MNPHVQAVQNIWGKGGRGYFRPSYGHPKFTLFSKKGRKERICGVTNNVSQFQEVFMVPVGINSSMTPTGPSNGVTPPLSFSSKFFLKGLKLMFLK